MGTGSFTYPGVSSLFFEDFSGETSALYKFDLLDNKLPDVLFRRYFGLSDTGKGIFVVDPEAVTAALSVADQEIRDQINHFIPILELEKLSGLSTTNLIVLLVDFKS
jgi:hypothetical protein